ncbi:MAG: ACP S-malonyltransferase [Armatimonadota bacterium]|nr:ACP S-malonyltransferase [Armatimonadota bacterium]MDW8142394.1 ACP S-malonyltransferase [Armatimonadota bacterium]
MGKSLLKAFPELQEFYKTAEEVTGRPLTKLCFEGPEEELTQTINAQPAIFTTCFACWVLVSERGIQPKFVAGHSLGEWTAVVASGALEFEEGLKLVAKRGELMNQAPAGSMAAILGASLEQVEKLCQAASEKGIITIANYNAPDQIVISGEVPAVEHAIQIARQFGAVKAVPLKVSGAFHSPLMKDAKELFRQHVEQANFKNADVPVVANVTGQPVTDGNEMKRLLVEQLISPVRWVDCVKTMHENGVKVFVELGPGRVLSGLVRRIVPDAVTFCVEDPKSFEETVNALESM